MAISEKARSKIAQANAPTTTRPKPDVKPVLVPHQPDEPQRENRPLIKKTIGNLAVRIGLGTLALGGIGYGGYEAYQHDMIPGIHRTTDIPSSFDGLTGEKIVKDNQTVITSFIGDKNTLNTTLETIQNAPAFDSEGNLLLYITPPKQGDTIKYSHVTTIVNAVIDNINTTINSIAIYEPVNKDYSLPMPINGSIVELHNDNYKGDTLSFWIFYKDSYGKEQRLLYVPMGKSTVLQDIPKVNVSDPDANKKGVFIKRGTFLLKTDEPLTIFCGPAGGGSLDIRPLTITDTSGLTKIPRAE